MSAPLAIRPMLRFGHRWLAARLAGRPSTTFVSYVVTGRCTRRCAYCNGPTTGAELTFSDFLPILDDLVAHGLSRLGFTGGEPLLHPELGAMLRACRERGVLTVVSTNGDLVPAHLETLRHADWVSVSLDGREATHDEARGGGSYQAARRAIEALRGAGIPTISSGLIGAEGEEDVAHVLELARTLDFTTVWQPPFDSAATLCHAPVALPDRARLAPVFSYLRERARTEPSRVMFGPAYFDSLARNYPRYAPPRCPAGHFFWALGPDGRAWRCFPLVGQGEGFDLRRRPVAELLAGAAPGPCAQGCFCSGHVASQLLFGREPRFWLDLLSRLSSVRGRGATRP